MAKLKEGDKAVAFSLLSYKEKKVSLKDFKGKKIVLYFYPKDMTPGCTTQACDFSENLARIKRKGAVVIGVSKDSVDRHQRFKDKYDLKIPLLADEDGKVCQAYGVWKQKSLYGKKFMGIERTTFIINTKGKIHKIFSKVKVKEHLDVVLEELSNAQ